MHGPSSTPGLGTGVMTAFLFGPGSCISGRLSSTFDASDESPLSISHVCLTRFFLHHGIFKVAKWKLQMHACEVLCQLYRAVSSEGGLNLGKVRVRLRGHPTNVVTGPEWGSKLFFTDIRGLGMWIRGGIA